MNDNRLSGLALIAGSAGSIITMLLHPTGHDLIAPGHAESMAHLNTAVHALGMISVPILFLGALGLSRYLAAAPRLVTSALVLYAAGAMAIINAAALSGLVAANLAQQMLAGPPNDNLWRVMLQYTGMLNHAFATVFSVASAAAIILWSIAILRTRSLGRGAGIYGCVLAPLILAGVFSGHLRMNIHGFGMITFGEGIWFVVVGILLWPRDAA
jgi:hypothetical protein